MMHSLHAMLRTSLLACLSILCHHILGYVSILQPQHSLQASSKTFGRFVAILAAGKLMLSGAATASMSLAWEGIDLNVLNTHWT